MKQSQVSLFLALSFAGWVIYVLFQWMVLGLVCIAWLSAVCLEGLMGFFLGPSCQERMRRSL
jgi:hypothetical protein